MGKRSNFERNDRDYYPTPEKAVLPLLPHLKYGDTFCEPCAGNGALITHLEKSGMSCVFAGDIEPQSTGIMQIDAMSDTLDSFAGASCDYIITNPPWNRKILHPMIVHFSRIKPTWLLFDADWGHTQQSRQYMPLLRKLVSVGRVKWIPDSKMTGKDNCAWHLFDANEAGPIEFVGRAG